MMGHRISSSNVLLMVPPFKQILSYFYESYYATKTVSNLFQCCALMGSIVRCNKNTDTFYVIRYKVKI